jgi:hypothetical protein
MKRLVNKRYKLANPRRLNLCQRLLQSTNSVSNHPNMGDDSWAKRYSNSFYNILMLIIYDSFDFNNERKHHGSRH